MTRLDYIGITTADMGKALGFYRHLGLGFPEGAEAEVHVEATLDGGVRVGLDTVETSSSTDPHWTAPSGSPRISLAFRCDSPAEVDAKYAELVSLGHQGRHEPWDAIWGHRYATLLDPDGNGVDLYADL
ncbi:MAG: VOC family protein [Chloroflexota bacterium]|nr:VOC family protein [Chloroflexota bacterium]